MEHQEERKFQEIKAMSRMDVTGFVVIKKAFSNRRTKQTNNAQLPHTWVWKCDRLHSDMASTDASEQHTYRWSLASVPLKFLITNFFEAPVLLEATAEVLAIPLRLCSVIAEKLALLSCRVSSAIIRLALWLNTVWFKCFAKLVLFCSVAFTMSVSDTKEPSFVGGVNSSKQLGLHLQNSLR